MRHYPHWFKRAKMASERFWIESELAKKKLINWYLYSKIADIYQNVDNESFIKYVSRKGGWYVQNLSDSVRQMG